MGGHRFNYKKADKLVSQERERMLPVKKVIDILQVDQNDTVADLGAGNGYFTLPIAHLSEKVIAVDIEPKMLELLRERAEQEKLRNIETVVSDLESINIESDSVEKVLISMVIHEVGDISSVLTEIKRILKNGGTFIIIEWEAVDSKNGPPLHERIPSEKLVEIIEDNGFRASLSRINEEIYIVKAIN